MGFNNQQLLGKGRNEDPQSKHGGSSYFTSCLLTIKQIIGEASAGLILFLFTLPKAMTHGQHGKQTYTNNEIRL
jgi:hypothetical protein